MLIFYHLDPIENNVLDAKISTFMAKFPSHQHARTHIWHLSSSFFFFCFLLVIVDMKMGRQNNSHLSCNIRCTYDVQKSIFIISLTFLVDYRFAYYSLYSLL